LHIIDDWRGIPDFRELKIDGLRFRDGVELQLALAAFGGAGDGAAVAIRVSYDIRHIVGRAPAEYLVKLTERLPTVLFRGFAVSCEGLLRGLNKDRDLNVEELLRACISMRARLRIRHDAKKRQAVFILTVEEFTAFANVPIHDMKAYLL
jgi:hypothetical protein